MNFQNKIISLGQKHGSTVLTILGAAGMVGTVMAAVKATFKVQEKIAEARIDKCDTRKGSVVELPKLTPRELVQLCWKDYLPTIGAGTASLICIFGANALNRKQQASLTSAYAALEQLYREYRKKVVSLESPQLDRAVSEAIKQEQQDADDGNPPWDATQTFYVEGYPRFFESTMEKVITAEYCLNRNFVLRGNATLKEFLIFLGVNVEDTKDAPSMRHLEEYGWDSYIGETEYGYQWIDFDHIHRVSDDGSCVCEIRFPFEPHSLETPDCENDLMIDDSFPTCGIE